MRGHVVLHFQTNDFAEATLEDAFLDRGQQVVRILEVGELEIGIARHPEGVPAHHLHAGKERLEILADHLLERHVLVCAPGA